MSLTFDQITAITNAYYTPHDTFIAPVAQRKEHPASTRIVEGSSPSRRTKTLDEMVKDAYPKIPKEWR